MLTREDMMRELELLPVWQLRAPLPLNAEELVAVPVQISPAVLIAESSLGIAAEQGEVLIAPAPDLATTPQTFSYIASEDGDWLFVLPNTALQADEERLLQNIFKAIRIKAKPAEMSENALDMINAYQPKLLIAMGQTAAQATLQSTETIDSLRGRLHQFQDFAFVATYDLAHLLQNSPDKAKAWDDLCIALQFLQDFKIVNS